MYGIYPVFSGDLGCIGAVDPAGAQNGCAADGGGVAAGHDLDRGQTAAAAKDNITQIPAGIGCCNFGTDGTMLLRTVDGFC